MRKTVCIMITFVTMLSILTGCIGSKSIEVDANKNLKDTGSKSVAVVENTDVVKNNKDGLKGNSLFEVNTQFAFDIFSRLNERDKGKNIFISPLSISTVLSMVVQGAGTTTRDGMIKVLGYDGMELNEVNKGYKSLFTNLNGAEKGIQLDINNSIWVRKGRKIKDEFINVNKNVFGAYVTELDFSQAAAADNINRWIADSTRNKIKKIVEDRIPADVAMYLINAVYFKGEWTEKFNKKDTKSKDFHSGTGKTKEVMMMTRNSRIEFGAKDDFRVVRLPYGKGQTSMYCVLPDENIKIDDFIRGLNEDKWNKIKNSISKMDDVQLEIPRFKMEYGVKDLKETLVSMGMELAFKDMADFSGISDDSLRISRVMHKAVVEVNEEGSEAAGVTEVELQWTSAVITTEPLSFIADRPFLFFITEDTTGTILFMGKLFDV